MSIFSEKDWEYMVKIEAVESEIKKELSSRLEGRELNTIDLMFSEHAKKVNSEDIQALSDFVNGFQKGSVVQRIIEFYSEHSK